MKLFRRRFFWWLDDNYSTKVIFKSVQSNFKSIRRTPSNFCSFPYSFLSTFIAVIICRQCVNLFSNSTYDIVFVNYIRELLHTKQRRDDTIEHLKGVLKDAMISCEIEMAGPEVTACSQGSSFLPSITEDMFSLELPNKHLSGPLGLDTVSVTLDNLFSRGHTLVQILCQDHKGLIYDIMRTLKDYNIQV